MDDLVAPVVIFADRGVEFLDLEPGSVRICVAVNHPNDVGAIALALFGIDVELDIISWADRIAIAVTRNPQHDASPLQYPARGGFSRAAA